MPHATMYTGHTPATGFMPYYANLMLTADCTCDKCAHWDCQLGAPVRAVVNGGTARVAQCLRAALDDSAPCAEVTGPEAAVFTQAASGCAAFELREEEREALETMAGDFS